MKLKYNVGDKVRVKSTKDIYNLDKCVSLGDRLTLVEYNGESNVFSKTMENYCDKEVTIKSIEILGKNTTCYKIVEDGNKFYWSEFMFE